MFNSNIDARISNELLAQVSAVMHMLVDKGICTEQEIINEVAAQRAEIDQVAASLGDKPHDAGGE